MRTKMRPGSICLVFAKYKSLEDIFIYLKLKMIVLLIHKLNNILFSFPNIASAETYPSNFQAKVLLRFLPERR